MTDLTVQQSDALRDAIAIPGPEQPTFAQQHQRVSRVVAEMLQLATAPREDTDEPVRDQLAAAFAEAGYDLPIEQRNALAEAALTVVLPREKFLRDSSLDVANQLASAAARTRFLDEVRQEDMRLYQSAVARNEELQAALGRVRAVLYDPSAIDWRQRIGVALAGPFCGAASTAPNAGGTESCALLAGHEGRHAEGTLTWPNDAPPA